MLLLEDHLTTPAAGHPCHMEEREIAVAWQWLRSTWGHIQRVSAMKPTTAGELSIP
jgi:hypothetical protein